MTYKVKQLFNILTYHRLQSRINQLPIMDCLQNITSLLLIELLETSTDV
jgi:hypothetical protein